MWYECDFFLADFCGWGGLIAEMAAMALWVVCCEIISRDIALWHCFKFLERIGAAALRAPATSDTKKAHADSADSADFRRGVFFLWKGSHGLHGQHETRLARGSITGHDYTDRAAARPRHA